MSATCIAQYDICIARRETLDRDFRLEGGTFEDVAESPADYVATMTVKDTQESWGQVFITITGTWEAVKDACGEVDLTKVLLNFHEEAADLWAALPDHRKMVYYVELKMAGANPDPVKRLFQGDFLVSK